MMKLPLEFQPTKEPLQQGQAVVIFMGRGCIGGILIQPSKRKSKIHFLDNTIKWIENKHIVVLEDKRWIAQIKRDYKQMKGG